MIERVRLKYPPVYIYEQLKSSPYSFFLDSALGSGKLGKFSFIGIEPFLVFKSKRDRVTIERINGKESFRGNPFLILKNLFGRFRAKHENLPFPFTGGGVGYFSYDLKDFNERLPDRAVDDINLPDCVVCFYDTILAFDHREGEFYVISRQKGRLGDLKNKLEKIKIAGSAASAPCLPIKNSRCPYLSNFTKSSYIKAVERAKEYIKAGDIYQVNLSQRFTVSLDMDPFDLYKILRTINPAPFACFLNFGDVKIVSASPERFLKKEGDSIQTRPIKGTRPRGQTPFEDKKLKKELIASTKDRAENLMIIDLERNDLGRICEYGSVRVTEFMACEEYATVFHLVSAVEGKLRGDIDAMDCLMNCFPGGSITGAPKIRSMEIIEELEPVKRSVYTGSIGYIGFDGNMDTSIVIRTFVIKGGVAYFQVGGGIVYDSDPEGEYQETLDKAKALTEAVAARGEQPYEYSVSEREIHSVK